MNLIETDVIICGAGISGLLMAKSLTNRTNRSLDTRRFFGVAVVNTPLSAKHERCTIPSTGPYTGLVGQNLDNSRPRLDTGQETALRGRCCDIPTHSGSPTLQYPTVR